ncbi:MAG: hypothetical protein AB1631_29590 [Acidobacteriota bacterium]
MISRNRKPGPVAQALRAAASAYRDEPVETRELITERERRRREEREAILCKPQPKSNGRVDGIEI